MPDDLVTFPPKHCFQLLFTHNAQTQKLVVHSLILGRILPTKNSSLEQPQNQRHFDSLLSDLMNHVSKFSLSIDVQFSPSLCRRIVTSLPMLKPSSAPKPCRAHKARGSSWRPHSSMHRRRPSQS